MYIGNLGDFFYKNRCWLINQPKITKENKYNFIRIGGKIFKLNIYTGELFELNKPNNKNINPISLKTKISNRDEIITKEKNNTNINFYNNKNNKEKKTSSSKGKNIIEPFLKKIKNKILSKKRTKSLNINSNFSLTTRNFYKKKDNVLNIYLNKNFAFKGIQKRNKTRNSLGRNNNFTFDLINNNKLTNKSSNYYSLNNKKSMDYDNDDDTDDVFIQEDICEIKNEDNEIIKQVKNQIFKDRMFKIFQKKYNFFQENKNSLINVPKLKLDTAKNFYIDKKNSIIKKIYLNKTERNRNKINFELINHKF